MHVPELITVRADKIVSLRTEALTLNGSTETSFINSNYIIGNNDGEGGVVFSFPGYSFVSTFITNAKIINNNTGSTPRGIGLLHNASDKPQISLKNIKIVTEDDIIYFNDTSINVKNYGLFGNKNLTDGNINLIIGTYANKSFVFSTDLT